VGSPSTLIDVLRYAVARIFWTIPVVLIAITLTFFLVRATGGDPFRHGPLIGFTATGQWQKYGDFQPKSIRDNIRRRYGLDLPWYEQYANYVAGVATFNLGPSFSYRYQSVDEIIVDEGRITLELALLAFGLALLVGIPVGMLSALHSSSPAAHLERVGSSVALALPAFFVGTLLIYLLALRLNLLPTSGWDGWRAKILPVVTVALVPAAWCARLTRASALETLGQDYVRTAHAKGLRRRRIALLHVLRNSLVPVLSAAGPLLGALITTLFVVEVVFAIPGLARHYVSASTARDYPLLMGMTVVLTVFIIVANLLVDLTLAALDPRLRERGAAL
jgi:oligopeptide transport system permease protein